MDNIIYKVVNKWSGSCTVPRMSDYYLIYDKGTIVTAIKGSLGIMCFENERCAANFSRYFLSVGVYKILKVRGIGDAHYPPKISSMYVRNSFEISPLTAFYEHWAHPSWYVSPPKGTVCYLQVEVLT